MKVRTRHELVTRVVSLAPTEGIQTVLALYRARSPLLIWGAFSDSRGGGCLYEWLGRSHPQTSSDPRPGLRFAEMCGVTESSLIEDWDDNPRSRRQVIKALELELFYRGVGDGAIARPCRGNRGLTKSL